jgi:glyoxylate/hydroxypyruvate reductase A
MALLLAFKGLPEEKWARPLAAELPDLDIRCWPDIGRPEDIAYALVWRPEPGLLKSLPHLKVIFSLGAGADHILEDPDLPDVPIVRFVDADLTQRICEYVALHALFHHRRMPDYLAQQGEATWRELRQPVARDVNVGVMGLGELGRAAAERLRGLGFSVRGWSTSKKDIPGITCFAGRGELGAFLGQTDILACLLPLTPQTRGILNRELFARLRQDGPLGKPALINAGRGALQVEADILTALDEGTLGAATLDVFEEEPLPKASPLWRHPRIVVTPHNAALTAPPAVCAHVAGQIRRFEAGETLCHLIDRARGY